MRIYDWKLIALDIEDGNIVWARISDGAVFLELMAELVLEDRSAALLRCHFAGNGPNRLGIRRLRSLVRWVKEQLDVDRLEIAGATRTSGAGPGRQPPPLIL